MKVLRFALLAIAVLAGTTASHAQPIHKNNGSFLGHAYVTTASYITANVATVASNLQFDYGTNKLFVNCGSLNSSGQLTGGSATVPQAVAFLNAIKSWESSNPGYTFKVFAYLSGSLTTTDPNFIDVSSATVRAAIATESAKFTSASVTGTYVPGATRTFDGVLIDFEPAGGTSAAANTQFNNLKTMMEQGFTTAIGSGKLTAFAAPQYSATSSSVWDWSPTFYYYMALHTNYLLDMAYDSGSTTGTAYQTWMDQQAVGVLQAVAGEYWTSGHPGPTNGVKVLFGFPAYPNNPPAHYAAAEDTENAAIGITSGLGSVDAAALANFGAAAVFLTTNGSGSDGYASWATDWANVGTYW